MTHHTVIMCQKIKADFVYINSFKNIIIIKNILQNTWTKPLYNYHHRPLFCFFFLTGISALSVTIYLLSEQIIKQG